MSAHRGEIWIAFSFSVILMRGWSRKNRESQLHACHPWQRGNAAHPWPLRSSMTKEPRHPCLGRRRRGGRSGSAGAIHVGFRCSGAGSRASGEGKFGLARNTRAPGAGTGRGRWRGRPSGLGQFQALFDLLNAFQQPIVAGVLADHVRVQIGDFASHRRYRGLQACKARLDLAAVVPERGDIATDRAQVFEAANCIMKK